MNEYQIKWLDALRSGKYNQTVNGCLRDEHGFCCLGVVCDVIDSTKWLTKADWWEHDNYRLDVSENILDLLNLSNYDMSMLIDYNDLYKLSFVQIAKKLEDYWIKGIILEPYNNEPYANREEDA